MGAPLQRDKAAYAGSIGREVEEFKALEPNAGVEVKPRPPDKPRSKRAFGPGVSHAGVKKFIVGGGVGKLFSIGKQTINSRLEAYYMVERPTNAPDWQIIFTWQFLFPKK